MEFSVLGAGLFTVTIGLWIAGMGLAGLADLETALKIVFLVGIVTGILFTWTLVLKDYFSATILGVAGIFNFMQAGISGFYENYDDKTASQVLSYIGIFLLVAGAVAFTELALTYVGAWLVLAGIILFLITSAVYGKAPKACSYGIIGISIINTVLSYMIWLGL
ncbi:MAG: hypothetical protein BTN85_0910 [Candidatus Methanohalarchaeum thermophilum]|uniref:Uncharacterized protein n=1 Tax=Methanohalarchaeum thermophilum TaxID=1903181 RepID=A0A1Q6DVM4_METT1|nr:MAG: hypothetical protein BTN85_0910 [Candidatus Methanohalarchaeum thermophilum]